MENGRSLPQFCPLAVAAFCLLVRTHPPHSQPGCRLTPALDWLQLIDVLRVDEAAGARRWDAAEPLNSATEFSNLAKKSRRLSLVPSPACLPALALVTR